MRLNGKVVIVTGASSWIGRAIALRFGAEGACFVLADVTEDVREVGKPTATKLAAAGVRHHAIRTDVSREADAEAAVGAALERFGRLDVLVNNAAIGSGKPLLDCSLAEWHAVLAVNLAGAFLMARATVRAMLNQDPCDDVRAGSSTSRPSTAGSQRRRTSRTGCRRPGSST